MTMPDKIEKILKEIHLLFAKADSFENSETQIIVNKKDVFRLLEKLNYAVMEVMDQYQVNERSKEQAISKIQKEAQGIIDDASKSAEQIYAASIIYTDDALIELRDMVRKTRDSIEKEYKSMFASIDSQIDTISKNKDELHRQLSELSSGNEYINIIQEEQKRRNKERDKYNRVENGEHQDNTESRLVQYAKKAIEAKGEEGYNEPDDFEKRMASANAEAVITVNTNHPAIKKLQAEQEELDKEYFQWQEEKSNPTNTEQEVDVKNTFLGRFFKDKQ